MIYKMINVPYRKFIGIFFASVDIKHESMRNALGAFLPDYMVPIRIFVNIELPNNAIVKVDRFQYFGFFI